jgi:hypothetical protein
MKKFVLLLICLAFAIPCHGEALVASTSNNLLLFFDSGSPGTLTRNVAVTGLTGGETIIGMDYRRKDGALYAVTTNSRLYKLNETTGAATAIGSAGGFTITTLSSGIVGFNFDQNEDRLRLVGVNQNIRINPDTGTLSNTDTVQAYVVGDPNAGALNGGTPIAYTNNFLGATTTVAYGIDVARNILYVLDPADQGKCHTIGALGPDPDLRDGFDISGATGVAYACLSVNNVPTLYGVNLGTGVAVNFGRISTAAFLGSLTVNALTVPTPTRVLNLATRGFVGQGQNVLIGGFIARGSALTKLAIRGIGPSLSSFFSGVLANPKVEVFDSNGVSVKSNDDWKNGPQGDQTDLIIFGLQPTNDLEAATVVSLAPGAYTAVVSTSNADPGGSGVALVEIYQL